MEISLGGSLEGKKAVAAAVGVTGCPHWTIGVVAGFAGPRIDLADLDTCGFNLSGMSSSGKTTAQKLAASVWAKTVVHRDGLFQTAKATVNSMEIDRWVSESLMVMVVGLVRNINSRTR